MNLTCHCRQCFRLGTLFLALCTLAVSVHAETYNVTSRLTPGDAGELGGIPEGAALIAGNILDFTTSNGAALYIGRDDANKIINADLIVSGRGAGTEYTGVLRTQKSGAYINGTVTLASSTRANAKDSAGNYVVFLGAHDYGTYDLIFTNQITSTEKVDLVVSAPINTTVILANTTANPNNYIGDTVVGVTNTADTYLNRTGGVLKLGASDQIPDVLANAASTGILILNAHANDADNSQRVGRFDLNGFNETVNGLSDNFNAESNNFRTAIFNSNADKLSTLKIGADGKDTTYNGNIGAGGTNLAINKIGGGKLTLTGDLTHTGGTAVEGGELVLASNVGGTLDWYSGFSIQNDAKLTIERTVSQQLRMNDVANLAHFGEGGGTLHIANATNFYTTRASTISTTAGSEGNVYTCQITGVSGINLNGQSMTFDIADYSKLTVNAIANNSAGVTKTGGGELVATIKPNGSENYNIPIHVTEGIFDLTIEKGSIYVTSAPMSVSGGGTLKLDRKSHDQMRIETADFLTFGEGGGTFVFGNGAGNIHIHQNSTVRTTADTSGGVSKSYIKGNQGLNINSKTLTLNVADATELTWDAEMWNNNAGIVVTGDGAFNLVSNFRDNTQGHYNFTSDVARLNIKNGATVLKGGLAMTGGVFSPGGDADNPFGTATLTGALDMSAGSTLLFEIGSQTDFDTLVLNNAAANSLEEAAILVELLDGYAPGEGDVFELITGYGGTLPTLVSDDFFTYDWNNGSLFATALGGSSDNGAVPEPATWALMLLAVSGMWVCRKKR